MKFLAVLALMTTLAPSFASTQFGGMKFHSGVPEQQASALKNDLKYLYKTNNIKTDAEFLKITELKNNKGAYLHNWLLNRVRYVIGENFELNDANILTTYYYPFPKSPLPDVFGAMSGVKTVMSNTGGMLYLVGKKEKQLFGIRFDGENVYAKSARVGILQVGEGLFLSDFQFNKDINAPANSVSRLATLFHEARHSDGNGKSTGFTHDVCPLTHPYGGYAACETSGNGSYTVGALAMRDLLQNCVACNAKEKSALTAAVADQFSRILDAATTRKELLAGIETYKNLAAEYAKYLKDADAELAKKIEAEIAKINVVVAALEKDLRAIPATKEGQKPVMLDADPEGTYKDLTVLESMKLMEASLK